MNLNLQEVLDHYRQVLGELAPKRLQEAGESWAERMLGFYFGSPELVTESVVRVLKLLDLKEDSKPAMPLLQAVTPKLRVRDAAERIWMFTAGLTVTYHCRRNHPYYPPPEWFPGKRCWCGEEIERED